MHGYRHYLARKCFIPILIMIFYVEEVKVYNSCFACGFALEIKWFIRCM